MDATVAVTGAAGFIGEALVRRLANDARTVVGVDLAGRAVIEAAGGEFRAADVADPAAVRAALRGVGAVVHTAALVSDQMSMADAVRVNTRGTRNVLDAADGARVVSLSSVAIWGYDFRRDQDEGTPPRTTGVPYIDTKGAAERLTLLRGGVVVRPGDVYGPRSQPWVVRPLQALRAGLFRLPGRGDGVMTPVYVDDLVDAVVCALDRGRPGRAYTVWDGRRVSAREFFSHHARWLGMERAPTAPAALVTAGAAAVAAVARLRGRAAPVTPQSAVFISRRAAYPSTRAREELGWTPRVDLEEGMARSRAWAREAGLLG